MHEVKRHCRTVKHTGLLKTVQLQPTISTAIAAASNLHEVSIQDQVTKAELYFSLFVAEHNLSFSTANHFTKLCKKMFPDSRIASQFSCARTKVRSIITHAIAPTVNADVVDAYYGGNDKYNKKYFGIMVRYWDDSSRKTVTRFLSMPVCNIATAQNLFDALSNALSERNILLLGQC